MGQIKIKVNGRTYRLACGDGEEDRLSELGAHVQGQVEALAKEFGQVGDDRLMVMSLLLICDELWEARAQIAALEKLRPGKGRAKSPRKAAAPKATSGEATSGVATSGVATSGLRDEADFLETAEAQLPPPLPETVEEVG